MFPHLFRLSRKPSTLFDGKMIYVNASHFNEEPLVRRPVVFSQASIKSSASSKAKDSDSEENSSPGSGSGSGSGSASSSSNDEESKEVGKEKPRSKPKKTEAPIPETDFNIEGEKVVVLKGEGKSKVYVFGTNHLSMASKIASMILLMEIQPQVVMVELCKSRAGMTPSTLFFGPHKHKIGYFWRMFKELGLFPAMILFSMSYLEKYLARTVRSEYGAAQRCVLEKKFELIPPHLTAQLGYQVMLGDRPVEITLKRMALGLNMYEKFLMSVLTFGSLFLGIRCFLLVIPRILIGNRNFKKVLVAERDVYLTNSLQHASKMSFEKPTKVVGIVGADHVPGIIQLWGSVTDQDVQKVTNLKKL